MSPNVRLALATAGWLVSVALALCVLAYLSPG